MSKISLYTDGGSRNNPGPAGIAGVIYDEVGRELFTFKKYIGIATNNQAEYRALIEGLKLVISKDFSEVRCFLDSELVVRQLNGQYKIKDDKLRPLAQQVSKLVNKFKNVTFSHVVRTENKSADSLVNEAIDEAKI